ncbi:50S ribosomal protein L23 [bacterium]|nr:50S ribosomal protein L23 [bacterium]
MKLDLDAVIQPMVTEKSSQREATFNEYAVVVDKKFTKLQIKDAIEKIFGVRPLEVRTSIFRKKIKRSRYGITQPKSYKKALVRLPEGKRLEVK